MLGTTRVGDMVVEVIDPIDDYLKVRTGCLAVYM